MRVSERFPDPARPDAGLVLSREWAGGKSTAAAILATWQKSPWPDGLLSYSLYLDADGDLIRDYAQWMDEPVDEQADHTAYRLYRGSRSSAGEPPGAMVAVRVDTDDGALARTWVDAVFDALEGTAGLPTGGLGAFFHISTDGRHVLNYAEWASAEDHRKALAATGRGIAQGPLWDKVQAMPGVRPQSVTRYHLYRTLTP